MSLDVQGLDLEPSVSYFDGKAWFSLEVLHLSGVGVRCKVALVLSGGFPWPRFGERNRRRGLTTARSLYNVRSKPFR